MALPNSVRSVSVGALLAWRQLKMKKLIFFFSVFLAFSAFANQPPVYCRAIAGNSFANGCTASPEFSSRDAAASATSGEWLASMNASHSDPYTFNGALVVGGYAPSGFSASRPAGYTSSLGYFITNNWSDSFAAICRPVGGVRSAPTGPVEATACPGEFDACQSQIGMVTTNNVTAGYSRSVSGAGLYPPLMPDGSPSAAGYTGLPPMTMCIAGCQRTRGAIVDSWTSLEPTATGLYRQSDDWTFTGTGSACTATESEKAALKPDAVVPACVGFLGQVNGKTSCVAAVGSQNGITSTKPNLANVGNPTAGSSGGAGNIPATGGNGANAGGPKGSSDGSVVVGGQLIAKTGAPVPTGTASAPAAGEEQVACGAPGQPRCAIDESGTPAPVVDGVYNSKLDKFKSDADAARGTMAGAADKPFFSGWSVLFSAPPVAACSAIVLPSFLGGETMGSIDPCPVVDGVRYVMGLLWAMAGLFFSLRMIKGVV